MKTNDEGKKNLFQMETKLHHLVPFLPDISQCFKAIQVIEAEFKKNALTVIKLSISPLHCLGSLDVWSE